MNRFKSLSDSSTSESEEDGKRLQQNISYEPWTAYKRKISTDDTEDEQIEINLPTKKIKSDFKSPSKYIEREISTDTEDEHIEINLPTKMVKSDFKSPSKYVERDLSDSESDDKNSFVTASPSKSSLNMPTKDNFNNSYGVGMKLMEKMGYKSGTGLGKFAQGRVDIVHASKQRGRRGLGLHISGLEPSDTKWDFEKDQILLKEEIAWMPESKSEPFNIMLLRSWMKEGKKKIKIDDETHFCDPDILRDILAFKSVFDNLSPEEMRKARTRSNPFEVIKGGIFLNRAAMKMANMDSAFDFMFTNPKDMNGLPVITGNELLYFADLCAGPGGFSEYVLWKKKWECKGFGITLKDLHDFKLEDFYAGTPETFEPYYGVKQDGNIYDPDNLRDFKKFIKSHTDDKGVHFVMADGGFSVEGQENEQEILSKQLYLCQFLCALSILRPGGHFVCKLFDLFTPFSVGLVYLMNNAFEKVCIFKPNTSRPANSERYIVCKWLKENTKDIADYMYEVNCFLYSKCGTTSDLDIREVVPLDILKEDEEFYEYIVTSNNVFGAKQIIHLDKFRCFAQNEDLIDDRQIDLRKQCLKLWKVPDEARSAQPRPDPDEKFKELTKDENTNYLSNSRETLNEQNLPKFKSLFDFHCVVCGESDQSKATLFLGLGRTHIYRFDFKSYKWYKVDCTLELPADTLFYGELILELKGEGRGQKKIMCLHIIDAMYLGGKDVRSKHYCVRMQLAEKLAKAVSKTSIPGYTPIRVKNVYGLQKIFQVFDRLIRKMIKNNPYPRICFDLGEEKHMIPTGLLIMKTIKDPWVTAYSKTNRRFYYFDQKRNKSSFDITNESIADFQTCFKSRIVWNWTSNVQLLNEQTKQPLDKTVIHRDTISSFITENLNSLMGR